MAGATELSPEHHPWIRPDILPHAIASAGWGTRYPGLCYEYGEPGEGFVPHNVIKATFSQERFAVVIWQPNRITFVDVSHQPKRTFTPYEVPNRSEADWAVVKWYDCAAYGAFFIDLKENLDPRELVDTLYAVMATPLGAAPGKQDLIEPGRPVTRLLIEFPGYPEDRPLPLDTSIAALGGLASQAYFNTIYSAPKV